MEKYQSIGNNRKTTRFRIFDEFCLSHLQFMATSKGNRWTQLYTMPEYTSWCGYAFEMICYKQIESIKKEMKCDQIESTNYSWSNNNAQIDLVIDRNDNIVNLCEIKFYNDKFVVDSNYASALKNKETQFKNGTRTRMGINTIIISTWGTTGPHGVGLVTNSLTMECLFN